MSYRVVVHRQAVADLEEAYRWARKHAPETAARWMERFRAAIHSLDQQPERCSLAAERVKKGMRARELHFGDKPFVYRAIFVIDGDFVRVLRIRRAQRRGPSPRTLRRSLDDP